MSTKEKKKGTGISLKTIHIWMVTGAVLISIMMLYSTFDLFSSYRSLSEASTEHIKLRKDARELMDASDYLTERVQRFTVEGNTQYLNEYFSEAFSEHHREKAISKLSERTNNKVAVKKLEMALANSIELMNREYYAMKLVIEAKGYEDYPELLRDIEITSKDKLLSSDEKMYLATKMVLDDEYYEQKEQIRLNMQECLDELEKAAIATDESALKSLSNELTVVRLIILVQTAGMIFLVWLTARLGIHPVLRAVDQIKSNHFIKESGAREFRYLVKAYNKMYAHYKKSLEKLNFKALHDELTGAYNRAGYQSLVSGLDLNQTCMILFDVDNFKSINDNYGHETGDKVLIKLVNTIKKHFRTNDYICRIGGDEFVIFMGDSPKIYRNMISNKIDSINKELTESEELPSVTISVGVVHGSHSSDPEDLLKKTDRTMYESKQKGKCTVTFYSE